MAFVFTAIFTANEEADTRTKHEPRHLVVLEYTVLVPSPKETVEVTLGLREKNGSVHFASICSQGNPMLTKSQQHIN